MSLEHDLQQLTISNTDVSEEKSADDQDWQVVKARHPKEKLRIIESR